MVTTGLLVRFEAATGKEAEVEDFLRSALPMVREEAGTTAWFGIRFARSRFGILDVFPDSNGRLAHLAGRVPRALAKNALALVGSVPDMRMIDVLADKLSG